MNATRIYSPVAILSLLSLVCLAIVVSHVGNALSQRYQPGYVEISRSVYEFTKQRHETYPTNMLADAKCDAQTNRVLGHYVAKGNLNSFDSQDIDEQIAMSR